MYNCTMYMCTRRGCMKGRGEERETTIGNVCRTVRTEQGVG